MICILAIICSHNSIKGFFDDLSFVYLTNPAPATKEL